jgi:Transposase DDE domain
MKSFRPRDGSGEPPDPGRNGERDFHGEHRTNETHASATDPEAKLFRKGRGKEAKLSFIGHALMENRHGLLVDSRLSEANGTAEREVAATMLAAVPGRQPITVGGDKGFDTKGFVAAVRDLKVTPHVAQNTTNRRSAIDGRTTRHSGYVVSQRIRKRIEEAFGWIKEIALQRRARHRGKDRVGWQFTLAAAAYNLIRLPKLLVA